MADRNPPATSQPSLSKSVFGLIIMAVIVLSALLFVLARQLGWTLGWLYVAISIVAWAVNTACLVRWNPILIKRRMKPGKGTKTWDIGCLTLFAILVIAVYVLAFIERPDAGWGEPAVGWLLGLVIFVASWALAIWAMVVNPFFEKTVRIQSDHGHSVIDTGPYAYVRHPGYVGFSGWLLSTPLLLESDWAHVPAALSVIALVIRTALEDRTLQRELHGYAEYAARVRYRLVPGIW